MNPLLLVGLALGALYAGYEFVWKRQGGGSGDGSSPIDTSTDHVLSQGPVSPTPEVPASNPTGKSTVPPPPGPPPPVAGAPVVTEATVKEQPQKLNVVHPAKQPKLPTVENEQKARTLAPQLDTALVTNQKGPNYKTQDAKLFNMVREFQRLLNLQVDGLYGSQTAGALMYFTGHAPPPPYFYQGERTIKVYLPVP